MGSRGPRRVSPAAARLHELDGPSQERIADHVGVSIVTVSRSLAGLGRMRPELLAVIRALYGAAIADEIAALAEASRREHLARIGNGDA